jgi:lipid-binding SYLF domain-containing protein
MIASAHNRGLLPARCALAAALLVVAAAGCAHDKSAKGPSVTAVAKDQTTAARIVEQGSSHAEAFLHHSQTEGIRNMLGGVRGVFMAPAITGGAALVGYESGTGFVMRRHGKDWSDPVFFTLSGMSAGWQVGGKEERMVVLLMTDTAVDNFIKGQMEIGGTGGFALGTWGMGAAGAGGIKGGLEELILTTNQGAFVGGGWAGIQPRPAKQINDELYRPGADLKQVLSVPGGRYAPAIPVRVDRSQGDEACGNQTCFEFGGRRLGVRVPGERVGVRQGPVA